MGVARNNSFLKLLREGDRDGGRARARERRRRGRVGEEIKEMAGIHTSSGTPYCWFWKFHSGGNPSNLRELSETTKRENIPRELFVEHNFDGMLKRIWSWDHWVGDRDSRLSFARGKTRSSSNNLWGSSRLSRCGGGRVCLLRRYLSR
jgi:hypothetical protein